jgi:hypothetical protein
MQVGTPSHRRNPTRRKPLEVRLPETCWGRRAWHARREPCGNREALSPPEAPTAGANRDRRLNDKKTSPRVQSRESDRSIVVRGQARAAPTRSKGPARRRSRLRSEARATSPIFTSRSLVTRRPVPASLYRHGSRSMGSNTFRGKPARWSRASGSPAELPGQKSKNKEIYRKYIGDITEVHWRYIGTAP